MRIKPSKAKMRKQRIQRAITMALVVVLWTFAVVRIGAFLRHDSHNTPVKMEGMKPFVPGPNNLQAISAGSNDMARVSQQEKHAMAPFESPLLIFTCKRDKYLKETLDDILKYIPNDCNIGCPVIISQDGNSPDVENVIRQAQKDFETRANVPLIHLQHSSALRGGANAGLNAYQALAIHYGWALGQVFDNKAMAPSHPISPQRVVILEEDLHIAPDFFSYFRAMAPVLDSDLSLLAVSAFNDNGYQGKVKVPQRVLRSDFFPGLGWMMTRRLWDQELKVKWPKGYWDDWLRLGSQRQGRHILRPEVSRTYHFGFEGGASGNQFGNLLQRIQLNSEPVDWETQDVSQLSLDEFDRSYWKTINSAKRVDSLDNALEACKTDHTILEYSDSDVFESYGRSLELMVDEKDGIFRTAYKGVVETRPYGDKILFLTPPLERLKESFESAAER